MERNRIYLSSIGADACACAQAFGLGIELAQFCTARNLDDGFEETQDELALCRAATQRLTLHAPFNELTPAAIDPLVLRVSEHRWKQAVELAQRLGIQTVIVHAGFIPLVYHPDWFTERSVQFWTEFLPHVPDGMTLCLENVMEPSADVLLAIVERVGSDRLRLCLDVGHANTLVSKEPVSVWVEKTAPYLHHVHLHNNDGVMDLHQPLAQGTLDMAQILTQLNSLAPHAGITLELAQCESSVQWLLERGFLSHERT